MAVNAKPRPGAYREGSNWIEDQYVVTGTPDRVAARNAITAAAGEQYISFPHPTEADETITLEKTVTALEWAIDEEDEDRDVWYGTVRWDEIDDDLSAVNFSLNIGTTTVTMKEGLDDPEVVDAPGVELPSFGRLINVEKVERGYIPRGVEIMVPTVTFEAEKRFTRRAWNRKTAQLIHKAGMVNSDAVTFNAKGPDGEDISQQFGEEELYFGGTRVTHGARYMTVAFQFLVSPSEVVDVPGIGNIVKTGWRYHWIHLKEHIDAAGLKELRPARSTVNRTYLRTTFGNMIDD